MVNSCFICKKETESCNHILLQYPLVYKLWTLAYSLLGINWVMDGSVREEIWEKKKRSMLASSPLLLFW